MMYNLIILGAGPAGLTSSLYAARYGLKAVCIGKSIGGTANYASKVDNYPGFIGSGTELTQKMKKQAESVGAEFVSDDIIEIDKEKEEFVVRCRKKEYKSKSLIIALGIERKKLNIKGEKEFLGKGVSYCASCDGFFFKDKVVGVIGSRDSCANSALMLSELAKKVYLIYRGGELKCKEMDKKRIMNNKKIEIVMESSPIEIKGKGNVESFIIEQAGRKKEIKLDGVFIEAGNIPSSEIIRKLGVKTDEAGYIIVNDKQETNIEGAYAAGDITNSSLKQIIVACSQGAVAVSSAFEFLEKRGK